jgi:hydrogenase nickel incorporation protein HypA/HybF
LDELPEPGDAAEAEAVHFIPELAHAFLQCPSCGSPDFEMLAGRGVSIGSIEAESD